MWYAISILFNSIRSDDETGLCEEIIYCIYAESVNQAEEKALQIAKKNEVSYKISSGAMTTWKVAGISGNYNIETEKFVDGLEIFSRFLRKSEADSLLTPFEDD